ncbi:MAG: haloacid dehalogenase-like hydrolase [Clostridia bacterium]|nr:haloacid dehalogenase-like hydrolase [Clostridia bacterium]
MNKDELPVIALCYDFDKTLSPEDMQSYSLIPKLNCDTTEFWRESNVLATQQGMDKILSYMLLITEKANANRICLRESDFNDMGKNIELFNGVQTWFGRINNYAASVGVKAEHYIISAGLKEIIQGTSIAKEFTGIYASSFYFNAYGQPVWPKQVVNYTTKTQYLFRINKNCLDLSNEDSVNEFQPENERRIPLRNFIYIGDSETDIPAMKIIKNGGGASIGVYNPETGNVDRVRRLLKQNRINYLMPADYAEGGILERTVKSIINKMAANEELVALHRGQDGYVGSMDELDEYVEYAIKFITENGLAGDELNERVKLACSEVEALGKKLLSSSVIPPKVAGNYITALKQKLHSLCKD